MLELRGPVNVLPETVVELRTPSMSSVSVAQVCYSSRRCLRCFSPDVLSVTATSACEEGADGVVSSTIRSRLVAGESHRLEWLVLCGWPSVPQHGDQAYKVIVKVRIWNNGFYFTLRPDVATPLLGMRATTVREGPDIDETKVRVLSPIMHLFVSLSLRRRVRAALRCAVVTKFVVPSVVSCAVFWYRGDGPALSALRPEAWRKASPPGRRYCSCRFSLFKVPSDSTTLLSQTS